LKCKLVVEDEALVVQIEFSLVDVLKVPAVVFALFTHALMGLIVDLLGLNTPMVVAVNQLRSSAFARGLLGRQPLVCGVLPFQPI
jgi:hypothetical protein